MAIGKRNINETTMHSYLVSLNYKFKQQANPTKADGMKAYLLHQFDFFGIQTPERRKICKTYFQKYPIHHLNDLEDIVKSCFALPQREFHYFAIELFAYHKKLWKISSLKLIEYGLLHKSWWDTVDSIGSEWLGPYFKMFPEKIQRVTHQWNTSSNTWLQRSSIMFQKAYKVNTDKELLEKYILYCSKSKEFFIQKAIGWALREYSKTDPEWVKVFVKENNLAPLSKREALKRIDR